MSNEEGLFHSAEVGSVPTEQASDGFTNAAKALLEALEAQCRPARSCRRCRSPRAIAPCHKCGGPLSPVAEGWEWPETPDVDRIRELAREVGYGIGVHGSLERDLDLIAIPWTAEAVSPPELAAHIAAGLPGQVLDDVVQDKPSGRWSCNINPEGWFKMIDLSVMGPSAAPSTCGTQPQSGEVNPNIQDPTHVK